MYDVITMGSATVDVFARTRSKLIKIMDSRGETDLLAFSTGTKLLIDKLEYTIGGGGTNSATIFAKLGLKVAFLGKVGTGNNSRMILESLKKHKIDTSLLVKGPEHAGFSIILDNIERDRVILSHKGVNDSLKFNEIKLNKFRCKWIYSSSLMGQSFKTLKKVSDLAKKKGIKLAFNPSSYITEKGIPYLRPVLKNTTALIFNMHEAEILTGKEHLNDKIRILHSLGPKIIVITDGKNGVYTSDGNFLYSIKPQIVKNVIDTTGAGDTFAASFITGLLKKDDIEFAMRLGIVNAAEVIRKIGAKNGLLSWHEAIKKVNVKKRKIIKKKFFSQVEQVQNIHRKNREMIL